MYVTGPVKLFGVAPLVLVISASFGGVLVSYIMHRLGHPEWADQAAHTHMWLGALNTLVQSFPASVIAGSFHFETASYFEIEPAVRDAGPPPVDLAREG